MIEGFKNNAENAVKLRRPIEVYITFKNKCAAKLVKKSIKECSEESLYGDSLLVKTVTNPTDILWENLGMSSSARLKAVLGTIFLFILLLIIFCFLVVRLKKISLNNLVLQNKPEFCRS